MASITTSVIMKDDKILPTPEDFEWLVNKYGSTR